LSMSAKKFLLPAVGAAVVAGGAGAYWYYNNATMKSGVTPMAIAQVVPDDAYMATFVTSDLQAWAKLQDFGTPEARKILEKGLKDAQNDMLTKSKIDFEKDLKPWVGNAMAAVLPNEKGKEPNLLLVVSIRDKVSALGFAAKMASQSDGKPAKETDYKGTKVFSNQEGNTFVALVKDYLAIAPNKKTIEQAIDTSLGEPSLAAKPGVDKVLTTPIDLKNTIAQVYVFDYANAFEQLNQAGKNPTEIPPETLKQLKNVKSMVAGVGVDDNGIRMKAIATVDESAPKFEYKPAAGKVVAQFPTETLALISGANLSSYWSQGVQQAEKDPTTKTAIDQMREATKTNINLDLDKDILGWMNGEFGIGLIPSDRGILAQSGFGSVMLFDTSDRKTAEATLAKLDEYVVKSSNGMVQLQQRDVQGKKVTEWNTPYGSLFGHGWLDDDSVFVAIGGAPMVDVVTGKNQPLDNSDTFKTVVGSLPKQNLGYFYMDMDKTMVLVNKFSTMAQSPIPPEPAAFLNSIKGIGATSSQVNPTTGQFEMLLALKKATK
jgi:Protein of unknown function (DUF3352)